MKNTVTLWINGKPVECDGSWTPTPQTIEETLRHRIDEAIHKQLHPELGIMDISIEAQCFESWPQSLYEQYPACL